MDDMQQPEHIACKGGRNGFRRMGATAQSASPTRLVRSKVERGGHIAHALLAVVLLWHDTMLCRTGRGDIVLDAACPRLRRAACGSTRARGRQARGREHGTRSATCNTESRNADACNRA